MSYPAGETLVMTKLRAIGTGTTWTTANSAAGKWSLLNSGASDHYAIIKKGPGSNEGLALSTSLRKYSTVIEIWQSYTDDGPSYDNINAYGEAILDQFDAWRKLGDTTGLIEDANITRWDEVEEMWTRGGGPRWLRQKFYVEWEEENAITYAE